ncbi:MAG: hypothetical protein KAT69_09990 [Candidatus Aminicenantes bacterium]|nr:hypothetical protein [Candidatus Aminicenantes bacterium]
MTLNPFLVLSSDRLIDILSDLDQIEARSLSSTVLKQVAARGGSTHILRGSFTKAGEQFRIDAILQEASTMESVGSDRTNDYEKSIELMEKSVSIDPEFAMAYRSMAYGNIGFTPRANENMKKALDLTGQAEESISAIPLVI